MKTVREVESDGRKLAHWLQERASDFSPLRIVEVHAQADGNADGNLIIFLTVVLEPPASGDGWSTDALLRLYKAVGGWGYAAGYPIAPHVHLQGSDLAEAG